MSPTRREAGRIPFVALVGLSLLAALACSGGRAPEGAPDVPPPEGPPTPTPEVDGTSGPVPELPWPLFSMATIPDGRTALGPAFTGHDVHPGLDTIVFSDPPTPGKPPPKPTERQRPAPRTEQKHARRRQERNRNRLRRVITPDDTPPPF